MSAEERTGVMVVRAWVEYDGPRGFRARITFTDDLDGGHARVTVAAAPEVVVAAVSTWLEEFVRDVTRP